MKINYQLYGRAFFHEDCEKIHDGIMKPVSHEKDYSVIECGHCGKRGKYPVGSVGLVCAEEVTEEYSGSLQPNYQCGNCGAKRHVNLHTFGERQLCEDCEQVSTWQSTKSDEASAPKSGLSDSKALFNEEK